MSFQYESQIMVLPDSLSVDRSVDDLPRSKSIDASVSSMASCFQKGKQPTTPFLAVGGGILPYAAEEVPNLLVIWCEAPFGTRHED